MEEVFRFEVYGLLFPVPRAFIPILVYNKNKVFPNYRSCITNKVSHEKPDNADSFIFIANLPFVVGCPSGQPSRRNQGHEHGSCKGTWPG